MKIHFYFNAYTSDSRYPITLWCEAKNQEAARNVIMRQNPYIKRLQFIRTHRIE